MTTTLQTRTPVESYKMNHIAGRRRSKRLAAYDEEDGDFIFTRGSKRIKSQSSEPEIAPLAINRKNRKLKESQKERNFEESNSTLRSVREEKTCLLRPDSENDIATISKRRKTEGSPVRKAFKAEVKGNISEIESVEKKNTQQETQDLKRLDNHITVIPLPLSDTPILNRNKEFRNKARENKRRSSLGLRGRRASSLINNGHSAIPHHEVEISDFYKHIEAEGLSEPRRMKQLLTWTGERCMGSRPSHGDSDSAAKLAAWHIKEALLNSFTNISEFSDWFDRQEVVPAKIVKKPNPRNVELENSMSAVETRLKLLREERDKWKVLAGSVPRLPPLIPPDDTQLEYSHIDVTLLDPEQAGIFADASASSASNIREQISEQLKKLQSQLEFQIDQFADGVHKLEQYQRTIDRVADRILYLSARRLEEQEKRKKEELGTRDLPIKEVLRSLSRILPERNERH